MLLIWRHQTVTPLYLRGFEVFRGFRWVGGFGSECSEGLEGSEGSSSFVFSYCWPLSNVPLFCSLNIFLYYLVKNVKWNVCFINILLHILRCWCCCISSFVASIFFLVSFKSSSLSISFSFGHFISEVGVLSWDWRSIRPTWQRKYIRLNRI